jgi:predicted short-subunit dehydrogenase-like oxidoreductase (DUF2520 family)
MTSYLIIGDGRVAKHIARYFELESIAYTQWSRNGSRPKEAAGSKADDLGSLNRLRDLASSASHILLLISDRAIESFYNEHPFLHGKVCVHFSGSLVLPRIHGAHPLMTFSLEPYDLDTYRRIPFVIEKGSSGFEQLLPGLTNPHFALDPQYKPLYHALCVMSGNFTVILWEKVFSEFEKTLGLKREVLLPYLSQVTENLARSNPGASVLTGPLARGDRGVIEKHLSTLGSDPFANVYQAFVDAFDHKSELFGSMTGPRSDEQSVVQPLSLPCSLPTPQEDTQ